MPFPGRPAYQVLFVVFLLSATMLPQATKPAVAPESSNSGKDAATADPSQQAIVFERNATKIAYEADGSGTRETTVDIKIQSQAGVQDLAVLTFPYTSYNQTVALDYVRVKKPDGTVIVTPDYNVQDMPADVTRRAPMYSDMHEKHVTVKALGVGDVLEYIVRYNTTKAQVPGQFWDEYTFTKDYVIKDEELEISVPRDKYIKLESPDYPPQVKDDGAHKIYSWKTSNLKLRDLQELAKQREAPKPSVQLTTFHSWSEVGAWYEELQRPQVAVTPQLQAKAAELTKGLSNDDDRIRAIYNYVSTRFHYVSLSFGIGRYQPHPAEDVLENEYGDCKDKHTLLAALLRAAGYDAWPALINASRKIDPEMPSPGQFNHVITAVPRGVSVIWLDTTPEVSPYRFLLANLRDRKALVMPTAKPAFLMETDAQPPFPTLQKFTAEAKLSSDGLLEAKVQQTSRGDVEVIYRAAFRATSPAQWKTLGQQISYAQGFAGEVDGVTASALEDTTQPFHWSYDYSKKSFGDWDNHRVVAPLPAFGLESGDLAEKPPKEPYLLGALGELIYESKTSLPAGFVPKYSDKLSLSESFADYQSSYTIENGVLIANRRLVIKQSEVPLADWEKYKKFRKAIADERDRYIDLTDGTTSYPAGEGPSIVASAAAGNTEAMRKLGDEYDHGDGQPQDYKKAREWYEKAALAGDAQAMEDLGEFYGLGQGLPQDYQKAKEWYEKAAAAGNSEAMKQLGSFYHFARGVPQDGQMAKEWNQKAAIAGNVGGMYNLGLDYYTGEGTAQNYQKAREWFEKAAAAGNAAAMNNLAVMYQNGEGVPQNDKLVEEWHNKSAAAEAVNKDTTDPTKSAGNASASTSTTKSLQEKMAEAGSRNPQAAALMEKGGQAMANRDLTAALESFRQVEKIDPQFFMVHLSIGWMYYLQNNLEEAMKEFRLELKYYPDNSGAYRYLADALVRSHHKDEALDAYRHWVKAEPSNRDAALKLAKMLNDAKQNAEAIQVLQNAIKLSPESNSLQYALGYAYLQNKQTDEGLDLLKKAVAGDSSAKALNDVAYEIADMNVGLDLAKDYGSRALTNAQADTMRSDDEEDAFKATKYLGNTWDTMGWIYFRLGQYDQALPYLRASWLLSQSATVGDHLAQTYEKLGKKQEAIHTYRLALAAEGADNTDVRKRYESLTGENADDADAPVLRRSAKGTFVPSPGEELSRIRTVSLTTAPHEPASTVFTIVFAPGKVEDVKYTSGSETLKPLATKIAAAKFKVEFPDSGSARLTRRALAACSKVSGCDVVLLLPNSVHAGDAPATKN